jgi:hypothetical protein
MVLVCHHCILALQVWARGSPFRVVYVQRGVSERSLRLKDESDQKIRLRNECLLYINQIYPRCSCYCLISSEKSDIDST